MMKFLSEWRYTLRDMVAPLFEASVGAWLSTSLNSPAIAGSGGGSSRGNIGFGNGGGDGSPDGKDDSNR